MKNNFKLALVFLIFMFIFIINQILPVNQYSQRPYSQRLFIIYFLITLVITVYIIFTTSGFQKNDILMALLLGLLAGITNPFTGVLTAIAYIDSKCMFKSSGVDIPIFKDKSSKGIIKTILISIVCGIILTVINTLGMIVSSYKFSFSFSVMNLFEALHAGISEEIVFRMFLFAICVYLLKGAPKTKMESFLCYIIMIVPHVLLHFPEMIAAGGVGSIIVEGVGLSLLFGLPLAVLQRKRDLFSAMGTHTIIDLIRFICFNA